MLIMKKDIIYIIIFILLILALFNKHNELEVIETVKIVEKIDTIIKYTPKYDTVYLAKYFTKYLPTKKDTTKKEEVIIPITTKVYKDSLYEAQISGFQPELDYIKVFPKTYTVYNEKLVKSPKKRFNWGLQLGVGYGIISNKPDIFVGIGGQYNF